MIVRFHSETLNVVLVKLTNVHVEHSSIMRVHHFLNRCKRFPIIVYADKIVLTPKLNMLLKTTLIECVYSI